MKKESGFAHVFVAVILILVAVVGLAAWRVLSSSDSSRSDQPQSQQQIDEKVEESPILQNVGIDLENGIDYSVQALREYDSRGLKGFYGFGESLEGGRQNPNYEFSSVKSDAPIIASIDGTIAHITEQSESKDFEVFLKTTEQSSWTIGYDHLVNLTVKKGQAVKAGDTLGYAAVQNNGQHRFEMQINQDMPNGETIHYCPSTLLEKSLLATTTAQINTMLDEWNKLAGKAIYDATAFTKPACLKQTLTSSEAEGR